jgi:hypothetical protein
MDIYYEKFLERLDDAIANRSALGRISAWLPKNAVLNGNPYSFKDHEFQIAIIDSKHDNSGVMKPSQVGLTQASIALATAFTAIEFNVTTYYLMPTIGLVHLVMKSRLAPFLEGSPKLKALLVKGSDSASFKQLGSSQIIAGGTHGSAVISVPTDLVLVDELDFCNLENVATAESRLTHSRFVNLDTGNRGLKRKWSTPTNKGFGIHKLILKSNQMVRMAKCIHCRTHFYPEFLKHVTVTGWDDSLDKLTAQDAMLLEERGLVDSAVLRCPNCKKTLDAQALAEPNREWVATYPSRTVTEGWLVNPFDLPTYHTPASILRKLISYDGHVHHFHNFVLGLPYSDATTSVMDDVVESSQIIEAVGPGNPSRKVRVAGMDFGLVSHLVIGEKNTITGDLEIIWLERIKLEDGLKDVVLSRLREYNVRSFVPDALPYTPIVHEIQTDVPSTIMVYPNYYSLKDSKLPSFIVEEGTRTVSSHRTRTLDETVKKVNGGMVKFPKNLPDEMGIMRLHLQNMKRVESSDGEIIDWVKDGADHYFHALNYFVLAANILSGISILHYPLPGFKSIK